jgi:hypothetical protein
MQAHLPEAPATGSAAATNPYIAPADYGRPLDTLLAGAALSLGTLAAIIAIAYKTWYLHQMAEDSSIFILGFLFFVYTGGVWIFSYAWERGDASKAIRMTVAVVVLSAIGVLALAIAFAMLSRARGGGAASSGADEALGHAARDDGLFSIGGILRTAGSYVDRGRLEIEEPEAAPSELETVACDRCGARFIPVPPKALCPYCGTPAVTIGAGA